MTPHRRRFLWLFSLKSSKKTQAETSGRATPQPKPSPSPSPPKPSSTHNQHGSSSKLHPDARSAGGSTLMQPDTSSGMPARTPPLSTSASSIRSSSVETTAEDDQVPVSAGKLNVPSSGSLSTSQASSLDKPPPRSSSAASLASMLRRGSNGLFSSGSENKKTHTESSEIQKYRDTSGSASADEKKKDKKPRKRDRLSIAFGGSKSKKPDFSHLPPSPKLSADMIDAWQQQPPQPSPSASDEHSSVESGKEAPAPPLHVSGPPPVSSAPPSEGIPPHPPVLPRTESAPSSHPVESYMPVDSFVQKRLPMPPYPSSESSTPDGKEATEVFTSAQASPPPTTIQQRDSIPLQLQPVVMSQQLHPFPQHQPEEVPTPTTATSSDSSGFGVAKDLPQPPAKSRSTSNHQSQGLPPRDASMTQPARQTKSSQASSVTSNLSATQYPWVNSSVRSQSPEPIVTA